jgi:predicted unusual protein kinase regulating ubiquinone biosynthesis (AarF/ABC1/UbiB family)
VVVDEDPAGAIVREAEAVGADVLVVGNAGMKGRKEFLLHNVPNRISHAARCTLVIVNTQEDDGGGVLTIPSERRVRRRAEEGESDPHVLARSAHVARVFAKAGLKTLIGRDDSVESRRRKARRLRGALEELGPTFCKMGQILSTRPDLIPPEFVDELAALRDSVPPLTEEEVVAVMESELGVPWEDVFESIDASPLAAASIGQVHRARLATGERVVVKVQRPSAKERIEEDLALLELFARQTAKRPQLTELVDLEAVFDQLSTSLHRELDFRQEAANLVRMKEVLEPFDRMDVPAVYAEYSTGRLLVMEEIQGGPITGAPDTPARQVAARQLLESYYHQIMVEGFFHADPHPGNLMWWDDRIYFLDLGMVGEVGAELREKLILLMMAFWQEDAAFLTDVALGISNASSRSDLDVEAFQKDIGELMARHRGSSLRDIQLGPVLQDMSAIALRHRVPLPSELTLTGKALAQMQLAAAQLDPDVDPFEVAGRFLSRHIIRQMGRSFEPATLMYNARRFRVRLIQVLEAVERLIGARPGQKLEVEFRARTLEASLRRAIRRVGAVFLASAGLLATGLLTLSDRVPLWAPVMSGTISGLLAFGFLIDLFRRE